MKYLISKSLVFVIGPIWQPGIGVCARELNLTDYDLANIGEPTRENVQDWLGTHAGDFQSVTDFAASLEIDGDTVEIPWADPDSEFVYSGCEGAEGGRMTWLGMR